MRSDRHGRRGPGRWLALTLGVLGAGCGGGGTSPEGGSPSSEVIPLGVFRDGLITFYDATGAGNCSYDPSPKDLDVAAIDIGEYQGSAICGSCAEVEGPLGTVRVRIVDSCPDCPDKGHLDLSRSAFAKIANPVDGRVKVRWRLVACDTTGPVSYHFKDGSNEYWAALQVRNHRMPVEKLEYWKGGAWQALARESYNYFIVQGLGTSALKVRVTSLDGQTLEDTLPGVSENKTFQGGAQFDAVSSFRP